MNSVILGLVLLATALASSNADISTHDLDPRIVNGEDAGPNEFLYQVSLQIDGSHFCGGSVLNRYYVLTAAHCVFDEQASEVKIISGTKNLSDSPTSVHQAVKFIVHDEYNPSDSWINDIALIKVNKPFEIGPQLNYVPLPEANRNIPDNSRAIVSGWGRIRENGPLSTTLKKATIYITNQNTCKNAYRRIYDTQICASNPKSEKGACNGDSGGPLTVNGKIVGIVSWSRGCALSNYPTVYTRVPSYIDWIQANAV
ncbi:chymotrypsin-2-like [Bombus vosnesenskii]|uniref:chymotrypsin n=1 Tax=Bombus vosnesenskii TaxID=207650 RepID=A0A6J3KG47_9HYME|nr:chymotrypsin-2-like [Bombus vosnesenskii]